ncbi:MAG: arginyltransferase [Planctomycetaceae bacterium]|nr:arginyltransferase [Planctomycetaceae bacterium]
MARELEIVGDQHDCAYLSGRTAQMTFRYALELPEQRYSALLERGWRRFGRSLFRPICGGCRECQPLRICINEFQPSKSQRRILARNQEINLTIQSPRVTQEYLDLYDRYHADMNRRRNWPSREITADQYHESFVEGNFGFSREFIYRLNGKLVGLGIVDITQSAMSSIYFFYAPELRSLSLGTFSVLKELEAGRQLKKAHLYMGYYIRDCGSMNYKNRFPPYQILENFVDDSKTPAWVTKTDAE